MAATSIEGLQRAELDVLTTEVDSLQKEPRPGISKTKIDGPLAIAQDGRLGFPPRPSVDCGAGNFGQFLLASG